MYIKLRLMVKSDITIGLMIIHLELYALTALEFRHGRGN